LLLAPGGWLARVACGLGWVEPGAGLYPGFGAVWLGMLCDFLPFMVLPLYASVERLDWSLVEAARDLGAGRWTTFRHGLWPQLKPGLVTGWVLVFLPACGQFVIPDLLGGARTVLIGNAIQQQFGPGLDWPFGAAVAVVTLALVMAGLWLVAWAARGREMELP
jgi:spermidine/putrescine transport system permease protein